MHARPDLAGLTLTSRSSIYTVSSDSDSTGGGTGLFFTPHNDKDKVYQRLAERIYLLLDHETSISAASDERQLLDLCGSVWGVSDKTSVQFDAVVKIWSESILATQADDERVGAIRGRLDRESLRVLDARQDGWGLRLVEAIKEMESDIAGTLDDDNVSFGLVGLTYADICSATIPNRFARAALCVSFGRDNQGDIYTLPHYRHPTTHTPTFDPARRSYLVPFKKPFLGPSSSIEDRMARCGR